MPRCLLGFWQNKIQLRGKAGKRFALIKTRRGPVGLVHIKPASNKKNRQLKMVCHLSHRSVSVPRNAMLQRALKRLERDAPRIQAKAMAFQLRRGRAG